MIPGLLLFQVLAEEIIMRIAKTYFEQVPVEAVKNLIPGITEKLAVEQSRRHLHPSLHCRICRKPVAVEIAKTDGNGQAVHEECYMLSLTASSKTRPPQPSR
jgi:hypothetical protein